MLRVAKLVKMRYNEKIEDARWAAVWAVQRVANSAGVKAVTMEVMTAAYDWEIHWEAQKADEWVGSKAAWLESLLVGCLALKMAAESDARWAGMKGSCWVWLSVQSWVGVLAVCWVSSSVQRSALQWVDALAVHWEYWKVFYSDEQLVEKMAVLLDQPTAAWKVEG